MIPGIPGFRGDSNGRNRSSEFKESSRGQAASFRYTAQDRNPQTLARVSIQGEARLIPEDSSGYAEAKALYEKRFPDSSPLFEFKDFLLLRLVPREARFVAGFARAYTIDAGQLKEAAAVPFGL